MLSAAAMCLAMNLWFEARGEGIDGMFAVAEVTQRRVEHPAWPDTYCEVVYQDWQFSWTMEPATPPTLMALTESQQERWALIKGIGSLVDTGGFLDWSGRGAVTACADHYYNPTTVGGYPGGWPAMPLEKAVGRHDFHCRFGQVPESAPESPPVARGTEAVPLPGSMAVSPDSVKAGPVHKGSVAVAALMGTPGKFGVVVVRAVSLARGGRRPRTRP